MIWILKNIIFISFFCLCVTFAIAAAYNYINPYEITIETPELFISTDSFMLWLVLLSASVAIFIVYCWGRLVNIKSIFFKSIKIKTQNMKINRLLSRKAH